MMKSRKVAWVINVIIILLSTFIIGGYGLMNVRREGVDYFYKGENGEGISVKEEADKIAGYGSNLAAIARRNDINDKKADELENAVKKVKDVKSPNTIYKGLKDVWSLSDEIINELDLMDVSAKDSEYIRGIKDNLKASRLTIKNSGYNNFAKETNKKLSGFPQVLIRKVMNITYLPILD